MRKLRFLAAVMVSVLTLVGFAASSALAARPANAVTLTISGANESPGCSFKATLTLDSQAANAIKGGGHVVFNYYVSGASYSHELWATEGVDVTKRVRSLVDAPWGGVSGPFSFEVEAIGYIDGSDGTWVEVFTVSSDPVAVPSECGN